MVAKKMMMLVLGVLLLPGMAMAGGAAANIWANSSPPLMGPETNYMQSPDWVFFSACTAGDMITLKSLVDKNPELVSTRLPDGKIGLHLAAIAGKREAAEFLLDRGSDVNARDVYDKTPYYYATTHCNNRAVSALIRAHGGQVQPTRLYYGDGMYTLYRNCAYLGCPSCYWESVGGRPEPAAASASAAVAPAPAPKPTGAAPARPAPAAPKPEPK